MPITKRNVIAPLKVNFQDFVICKPKKSSVVYITDFFDNDNAEPRDCRLIKCDSSMYLIMVGNVITMQKIYVMLNFVEEVKEENRIVLKRKKDYVGFVTNLQYTMNFPAVNDMVLCEE